MKKLLTLILAVATTGLCATDFDDWDLDGDGMIEKHEFKIMFVKEYFDPLNGSSTLGIADEDFYKGLYAGLDKDGDRLLRDEEWLTGYKYHFRDYVVYENIDMIDMNMDGSVNYEEFYNVIYDTSYYTDIDLDNDNYISGHELAEFVFNNWDQNRSGIMTRSEFEMFKKYYLKA